MAHSAPLNNGTLLTIKQGGVGYPEGTCTGSYVRYLHDAILCYPIGPGTDGGLIIGKSQRSGGQELAPSGSNAQSGEMASAFFSPVYETLPRTDGWGARQSRQPAPLNRFDDVPCAGAACSDRWRSACTRPPMAGYIPAAAPPRTAPALRFRGGPWPRTVLMFLDPEFDAVHRKALSCRGNTPVVSVTVNTTLVRLSIRYLSFRMQTATR
jgi:hypothetical protein